MSVSDFALPIADVAQSRHSCKAFDAKRCIDDKTMAEIEALLRFAPSSINSQPWHYVLASSEEGKEKIASSMPVAMAYNASKVRAASHTVVLCCLNELTDAHIEAMVAQEERDGRYAQPEDKAKRLGVCNYYVGMKREAGNMREWMGKQVYLSLGGLLLGAAALGVDACPIEGFDAALLDEVLDLPAQGLHSLVVVALGYRSGDDFNAKLPKSRFELGQIVTRI